MKLELGDFVWYRRKPHVVLNGNRFFVELIRFGDARKRTFWTLRGLVRDFSMDDYKALMGKGE